MPMLSRFWRYAVLIEVAVAFAIPCVLMVLALVFYLPVVLIPLPAEDAPKAPRYASLTLVLLGIIGLSALLRLLLHLYYGSPLRWSRYGLLARLSAGVLAIIVFALVWSGLPF